MWLIGWWPAAVSPATGKVLPPRASRRTVQFEFGSVGYWLGVKKGQTVGARLPHFCGESGSSYTIASRATQIGRPDAHSAEAGSPSHGEEHPQRRNPGVYFSPPIRPSTAIHHMAPRVSCFRNRVPCGHQVSSVDVPAAVRRSTPAHLGSAPANGATGCSSSGTMAHCHHLAG